MKKANNDSAVQTAVDAVKDVEETKTPVVDNDRHLTELYRRYFAAQDELEHLLATTDMPASDSGKHDLNIKAARARKLELRELINSYLSFNYNRA